MCHKSIKNPLKPEYGWYPHSIPTMWGWWAPPSIDSREVGGLEMIWRGVCADHLWTRPVTGDGEWKQIQQILERPPSPREILEKIHKQYNLKNFGPSLSMMLCFLFGGFFLS